MKYITSMAVFLLACCLVSQAQEIDRKAQADKLLSEDKGDEFVNLIDRSLKEFPDKRVDILQHKLDGLEKLGMYEDALPVAEEIYKSDMFS
jgi:hypothetical protein